MYMGLPQNSEKIVRLHERLQQHLANQGHEISRYMVRQIKQEKGIYCKRHKRFKVTTDSNHNKPVYDNLLE